MVGGAGGFLFYYRHLNFLSFALGLEVLKKRQGAFELAGETLAVDAQIGESFGVTVEGGGDGDGFAHLVRRLVVREVVIDDVVGEQVGFERRDAVEAPGGVGEGLDELRFGGALRVVLS